MSVFDGAWPMSGTVIRLRRFAAETGPSSRALVIANGLVRTGRATMLLVSRDYVCLRRKSGGYYWVEADGSRLRSGRRIGIAEDLQPGFIAAMAQAGAESKGSATLQGSQS